MCFVKFLLAFLSEIIKSSDSFVILSKMVDDFSCETIFSDGVNFSQRLFLFCLALGLLLSVFFATTTLLFSKIPVLVDLLSRFDFI
jgi:hypothetical protein